MRWRGLPRSLLTALLGIVIVLLGIVGALGAAVLFALLVGIGLGADARGATVALWLVLPAWAGFGVFFLWSFWRRELRRLLERVLLTLALEAFTFPLASLVFAALLWAGTFEPVGEQTTVMGQAAGLLFGSLGVILAGGLIALTLGGLCFLLFVLLKFNLVRLGRAISLEAQRRMGE